MKQAHQPNPREAMNSSVNQGPLPIFRNRAVRNLTLGAWVIPILLFPLIAIFAPIDILDRWPFLTGAVDAVRSVLLRLWPQVDFFRHALSTRFPQVATVATAYAAVCWVWTTGITLLISTMGHRRVRATMAEHGAKKLFWFSFGFPLFALGGLFVFFALPGDPGFARNLTTGSRIGYAFMGTTVVAIGVCGIAYTPFVIVTLIFDVIFRRNRHG
jgi:hypothetical protein